MLWFILTQHMGLRGRQEHEMADIDDFQLGVDENAVEYAQFNDLKPTKTRQGGLRMKRRAQLPKMFATNDTRCPVAVFKSYLSRRPADLKNSGPLYLAIIHKPLTETWYKNQKMGGNRIVEIMERIVSGTSVASGGKRFTNRSARKTLVKKLDDADVPRAQIVSVNGHQNEKSLDDYVDSFTVKRSKQLSNIISGAGNDHDHVNRPTSSESHPLQELNTLPSLSAQAPSAPPRTHYPVLNLGNLAQNMENSTINITVNLPMPHVEESSKTVVKRRRVLLFYDSD